MECPAIRPMTATNSSCSTCSDCHGRSIVSRSDHCSTRLQKQKRLVGGFAVHLGGVFTVVLPDADDLGWDHRCQESDVRQFHDASLRADIHERVALDGCDDRLVRHLIVIVETVHSSEPNVLANSKAADQHRPTLITNGPHACEHIRPYVNASSSARHGAAMTFSCTPSVVLPLPVGGRHENTSHSRYLRCRRRSSRGCGPCSR